MHSTGIHALNRRRFLQAAAAAGLSAPIAGGAAWAQSKDPLKIGVTMPLTGSQAGYGNDFVIGMRQALKDLNDAADAVFNFQRTARGRDAGGCARGLHDKALCGRAFQPQAAESVEVGHVDVVEEDVDDVRVIPDRFGCESRPADDHAGAPARRC